MVLVKSLIVIKRLIYGVVTTILRPIFVIFKFLFTKPLIKLYHLIFKLRKSGLAESPWQELVKRRALHVLVLLLTLFMIVSNVINYRKETDNPAKLANKTIISHLVKNEFSAMTDDSDLVEETLNLKQLLASSREKYRDLRTVIQNGLTISEDEGNSQLAYSPDFLVSGSPFGQASGDNTQTVSTEQPLQNRSTITYYIVGDGDTISSIAKKFGISVNTVLWSNNLTAFSLIRAGNKLTILPISGVTYVVRSGDTVGKIARNFGIEENKIFQYNSIKSANSLVIGQTIIIPGGKQIPAGSTTVARVISSKANNVVAVIEKLVNPRKAPDSGSAMLWPTVGHRITQYFSWRHTGLDIANKVGTPLYAAADGKVEFSGWSNGYGNNIVINHGGGKKTRYAHASKLFVKVGDSVDRGEQIAAMGSTGWSTGPHIHFEVMINGTKYNPLSYIK